MMATSPLTDRLIERATEALEALRPQIQRDPRRFRGAELSLHFAKGTGEVMVDIQPKWTFGDKR